MSSRKTLPAVAAHAASAAAARAAGPNVVSLGEACRTGKAEALLKPDELPVVSPAAQVQYKAFWQKYHKPAVPQNEPATPVDGAVAMQVENEKSADPAVGEVLAGAVAMEVEKEKPAPVGEVLAPPSAMEVEKEKPADPVGEVMEGPVAMQVEKEKPAPAVGEVLAQPSAMEVEKEKPAVTEDEAMPPKGKGELPADCVTPPAAQTRCASPPVARSLDPDLALASRPSAAACGFSTLGMSNGAVGDLLSTEAREVRIDKAAEDEPMDADLAHVVTNAFKEAEDVLEAEIRERLETIQHFSESTLEVLCHEATKHRFYADFLREEVGLEGSEMMEYEFGLHDSLEELVHFRKFVGIREQKLALGRMEAMRSQPSKRPHIPEVPAAKLSMKDAEMSNASAVGRPLQQNVAMGSSDLLPPACHVPSQAAASAGVLRETQAPRPSTSPLGPVQTEMANAKPVHVPTPTRAAQVVDPVVLQPATPSTTAAATPVAKQVAVPLPTVAATPPAIVATAPAAMEVAAPLQTVAATPPATVATTPAASCPSSPSFTKEMLDVLQLIASTGLQSKDTAMQALMIIQAALQAAPVQPAPAAPGPEVVKTDPMPPPAVPNKVKVEPSPATPAASPPPALPATPAVPSPVAPPPASLAMVPLGKVNSSTHPTEYANYRRFCEKNTQCDEIVKAWSPGSYK